MICFSMLLFALTGGGGHVHLCVLVIVIVDIVVVVLDDVGLVSNDFTMGGTFDRKRGNGS